MGDHYTDSNEPRDDVELTAEDELEPTDKLAKLRTKLAACQEESKANLDGWQRAQADLVNARRELAEREARARQRGIEHIVEELAVVLDSFTMAMQGTSWDELDPTWKNGIEQIRDRFVSVLSENGLSIENPAGAPFDPECHECVASEPVADPEEDHVVLRTLQEGIHMHERVIRPAKVVVGVHGDTQA